MRAPLVGAPWVAGQTVVYTVERDGREVRVPLTMGTYPLGALVRREWGTLSLGLAYLSLGLTAVWRRPRLPAARILFLSGAALASATTWSIGLEVSDLAQGGQVWLHELTTTGAYFVFWASLVRLALLLPPRLSALDARPWLVPALYLAPQGLHLAYVLALARASPGALAWLSRSHQDVNWLTLPYMLGILLALPRAYRAAEAGARRTLRWLGLGLAVGVLLAAVLGVLPEMVLGESLLSWNLVAGASIVVMLLLGLAALGQRRLSLAPLVHRLLVYGVLTASVSALYMLAVAYLSAAFPHAAGLAVALLSTGLVALVFQPLRDRIHMGVDVLMYGQPADPYGAVSRLGEQLGADTSPEATLLAVAETVTQALRLPHATVSLRHGRGRELRAEHGRLEGEVLRLPLEHEGETLGELTLAPASLARASRRGHLLEVVQRQVVLILRSLVLGEALRQSRQRLVAAREEERRRLRRDLHDGLGPALAGLGLKVEAARQKLRHDPWAAEVLLDEVAGDARGVVEDVRRLVHALRPPVLDELGLMGALHHRAAHCSSGTALEVRVEGPTVLPSIPAAVEVAAFLIASEALTNVVRHAGASRCQVSLSLSETLDLSISDDGAGLPPHRRPGLGIRSMRERAGEVGGSLEVERPAGGGTVVRASLPLAVG